MTVQDMLARMSAEELTYWQAYDKLYKLPDRREDVYHAAARQMAVTINRKANVETPDLRRFMFFEEPLPSVNKAKLLRASLVHRVKRQHG